MSILSLYLNDAAITGVNDKALLFSEPGYGLAEAEKIVFGETAFANAWLHPQRVYKQYWQDLSETPLPRPILNIHTSADLVHGQLQDLWQRFAADVTSVVCVVSPHWSRDQLGLLLGILEELQIPVAGLVDSAVAQTRREYPGRDVLCLEASLGCTVISRMAQDGGASVSEYQVVEGVGTEGLRNACAGYIAEQFVESSRFDPLQNAVSEQELNQALSSWVGRLHGAERIDVALKLGDNEFGAVLNSDAMARVVAAYCEPVLQKLRSIVGGERPVALQVCSQLAAFPGLIEALTRATGGMIFPLEPGAAARGALVRRRSLLSGEGGVRMTNRLPWDQDAFVSGSESQAVTESVPAKLPTHLLFEGRAYRLGRQPFHIGTELSEQDEGLCLERGANGISRRHCTISLENGRLLVADHSRFGTRLNGHAIDSPAVLQPGDVIQIGSPAKEFALILEVGGDGQTAI